MKAASIFQGRLRRERKVSRTLPTSRTSVRHSLIAGPARWLMLGMAFASSLMLASGLYALERSAENLAHWGD